jgi:hypothetical protein
VKTQEVWSRKIILSILCMDLEVAFQSMVKKCLVSKIRAMKINECLLRWKLDLISDCRVKIVVNGQEGSKIQVNTSLLQGILVLPVLFVSFMVDIYLEIE